MKIERISDNQIRCTLTKEDLDVRQIKLTELAYGSEKAKALFREMMQQASDEVDFHVDDIPLMIEAIPVAPDSIVLIISKVEAPDELDTRFSSFTAAAEPLADPEEAVSDPLAEDIAEQIELVSGKKCDSCPHGTESASHSANEKIRMFSFTDLDTAIRLAHSLKDFLRSDNAIYKDAAGECYYLVLRQGAHPTAEFGRICHSASEYLKPERYTAGREAYLKEHLSVLLAHDALQALAEISL